MSIVRFDQVIKNYTLGGQQVQALKDITLNIENGAVLAIAGRGKPTQLNLIGCIDTPLLGRIFISGQGISGQMSDELSDVRARTIGFIFHTSNLLPALSAEENVESPLLQFKELSATKCRNRVAKYLAIVACPRSPAISRISLAAASASAWRLPARW